MKKYILKKRYPSLPYDWTVGIKIKYDENSKLYRKTSFITDKCLCINEVENNPEYWEEIVSNEYEILSFKYGNGCPYFYTLRNDGLYSESGAKKDRYSLDHHLKDIRDVKCIIHSIKRLSDGEIFTIGDKIFYSNHKPVVLEKITINNDMIFMWAKFHDNMYASIQLKVCKLQKPHIITTDGIELYEGDTVYGIGGLNWDIFKVTLTDLLIKENWKQGKFSTKKAAEEYILMNKPCLSFKEVLDNLTSKFDPEEVTWLCCNLHTLVKSKLNK